MPPAELLAFTEVLFDLFVQPADVDHDFRDTVLLEVFDQVGHHGFAQQRDHGFWQVIGQRTDACALACSENHGFH